MSTRGRARAWATGVLPLPLGAAALVGVVALVVSERPAVWAFLVALEVLALALVAGAIGLGDDHPRRARLLVALVLGASATLLIGPETAEPSLAVAAAAAMAWPASLLVGLVHRDAEEGPADVIALRRPVLAGVALVVVLGAVAGSGLRPTAAAFAVGLPLALLVLQLADAGPIRSSLHRWPTVAPLVLGAAATVLVAAALGDPGEGTGTLVLLASVLAVATAIEVLTARGGARTAAPVVAVVLAAAAIGAAPGGLVAAGVALMAGTAWVRTRFPQPAAIPQLLIDLTDGSAADPSAVTRVRPSDDRSPTP